MLSADRKKVLKAYDKAQKLHFSNLKNLEHALTHKSYAHEQGLKYDNEKLEYLGDSVLELIVNEYLYHHFPRFQENKLSRIKSYIVSKKNLIFMARDLKLDEMILLGRGESLTGGRFRESNLANAVEAIIGALYLDRGLKVVHTLVLHHLKEKIRLVVDEKLDFDHKSQLQEIVQKNYKVRPDYRLVEASGPDHRKIFKVDVYVNTDRMGSGKGPKKLVAEDLAAKAALAKLKERLKAEKKVREQGER